MTVSAADSQKQRGQTLADIWRELRDRERDAATAGYDVWDAYVQECERRLRTPWEVIRSRFNEMDKQTTVVKVGDA